MVTKKLTSIIIRSLFISMTLTSCGGNSTNSNPEERTMTYIVNHPDDVGKYGKGTYINMNTEYTDKDGVRWSKYNIFAPRPNESLNDPSYQKRNEGLKREVDPYDKGYEEGYNDARRKYDSN